MTFRQNNLFVVNKGSRVKHELRLRGYLLLELIGEGAYAKVWRGTRVFNKSHDLAIKVIEKRHSEMELLEKFLPRELELLRQVKHHHFIAIHDVFEVADRVFIVMDIAKCGSLQQIVERFGAMSAKYCRRILSQLICVVQYLHNHDIAHRDLKSDNVLLDEDGNVKLTDLGFSRRCSRLRGGHRLMVDTFCGSLSYCAPEIIDQQPYCPKRADIWSIGCIFYEIITGVLPFDGVSSVAVLAQQQARNVKTIPEKIAPFIEKDDDLKDLLYRLLDPTPDTRISLAEIRTHPWMSRDDGKDIECPLQYLIESNTTPIKMTIVRSQTPNSTKNTEIVALGDTK